MQQIEITKEQTTFYSCYLGEYNTPKKLNRSATQVPEQYIDMIEQGEITSTQLMELANIVPIYRYKTCLTIHGHLGEINRQRIGGYKNIHQNANGSLEIRYNAIDYKLKKQLAKLCQFRTNINSNTFDIINDYSTSDKASALTKLHEQKKWAEDIGATLQGMKAKISVSGYCYWGTYVIVTTIQPMLITGDILNIASQLTGKTIEAIQAIQDEQEKESKQREQEIKARQDQEQKTREEREQALKVNIDLLNKQYKVATEVKQGTIYALAQSKNIIYLYAPKKGNFGRYKFNVATTPEDVVKEGCKELPKGAVKFDYFKAGCLFIVEQKTESTKPTRQAPETSTNNDVTAEIYKNSILIKGTGTYAIKEQLKANRGTWNRPLQAWVFPQSNTFAQQYLTNK